MWFTVNGQDVGPAPGRPYGVRSGEDGSEWPTFDQCINDPPSNLDFQIIDINNQLGLTTGMEVIVWDEYAPPIFTIGGRAIPTVPSMNVAINPSLFNNGFGTALNNWTAAGSLPTTLWAYPQTAPAITFANNALGNTYQQQNGPLNYVKPGQEYMLSIYVQGSGTISNIQYFVQINWMDINGNYISNAYTGFVAPPTTQQRVNCSGVAPANAAFAQLWFGGLTTVAGSNSGVITFSAVQFEPMYFVAQGVSYPTPDCNINQVNCVQMPDGTISRMCRVFSGYIDDLKWSWEGGHRLWEVSVASAGMLLDNGPQINMTVVNQYDDQIITSVINTYFSGLLTIAAPNLSSPNPIVRGILVPSDSYADKTFRDVLNGLCAQSGFNSYVDPYYTVHYNPQFYASAPFTFSDQPDDVSSFEFHDFSGEEDATTRKRNIKILGGTYLAPVVDTWTATSGQTIFPLTFQPKTPTGKVVVNGSGVNTGVYGVHDPSHYTVLVDKAGLRLVFTNGQSAGTAISYSYSYEAPVSCQVIDQDTNNPIPSPTYAQPPYFSQVHDTSITSLAGGTLRGLAELTAWSKPKRLYYFSAFQYVQPGLIVFITSHSDNVINQPYVVTKVSAKFLGNGINEYQYTVGAYLPSIIDHIRYAYKAHQLSSTTANVTVPQSIDIVFSEFIAYSEQPVTYTVSPYSPPYRYGQPGAVYGFCSYS